MREVLARCVHCASRYTYMASGGNPTNALNDAHYCPTCKKAQLDALKAVPVVHRREWKVTKDVTVEALVDYERRLHEEAVARGTASTQLAIRRVYPGLIDLEDTDNKHTQGSVQRDGCTYRYEYWTKRGGMAAGTVYVEVEVNAETGEVTGPWSINDYWRITPTFAEVKG